jgi:hypothetical protein
MTVIPGLVRKGVLATFDSSDEFLELTKAGVSAAPDKVANTVRTVLDVLLLKDFPKMLNKTFDPVVNKICVDLNTLGGHVNNGKITFNATANLVDDVKIRYSQIPGKLSIIKQLSDSIKTVTIAGNTYTISGLPTSDLDTITTMKLPDISGIPDLKSYVTKLQGVPDLKKISRDMNETYYNLTATIPSRVNSTLQGLTSNPKKEMESQVMAVNNSISSIQSTVRSIRTSVASTLEDPAIAEYDMYR